MKKFKYVLVAIALILICSFSLVACNKCEHINKTMIENTATCESDGEISYKCNDCNKTIIETSKAKGHDYSVFVKDSATCTASGYITNKCCRCNSTKDVFSAKKKHNYKGAKCSICSGLNPDYEKVTVSYSSGTYRYSTIFERLLDFTKYNLTCRVNVTEASKTTSFSVSGNLNKFSLKSFSVAIYDNNNVLLGSGGIILSPTGPSSIVSRDITLTRAIQSNEICYISITTTA